MKFKRILYKRNNSETNLVAVFEVVSAATFSVSAFLLIFNVWRRQEGYLQLLEESRCKGVSRQKNIVKGGLVVYFVIWELFTWFLMHDSEHFLGQNHSSPQNNTDTPLGSESDLEQYLNRAMYWGFTVTYTHTYSFFVFVEGVFFALAFALRQFGAEFQTRLKDIKEGDGNLIDKGLQLYRQLKKTNDFVREMYGDTLLASYISFLAYTVEAPHIFLGRRGEAEKAIFIFYTFTTIIWILAAEFHYRAHQAILEWTTFYSECDSLCLEDRLKMFSIRLEVTTYPVFCLFFHTAVMFSVISLILLGGVQLKNNLEPSLVDLFESVSNFSNCVTVALLIFILWRRTEKYLELIESTRVTLRHAKKIKILIAWSIVTWFMLHDDAHYGSLRNLNKYFLARNTSYNLTSLQFCSQNGFECIFYLGQSIVFVLASNFFVLNTGFFLMLVLAMGQRGKSFESELKIGNKILSIQKGNELYRKLKNMTSLITQLCGNKVMAFYITSVCYYAQAPHIFLGKRGNTEKLLMAYFTLTSFVWILAAEFHKNVQETVLQWIVNHSANENLTTDDRLKLLSLSNEMTADPVALSSRYFSVTYQQLSAVSFYVLMF
ncbi:unnamed protein product [Orchesella dallaii]|uniref:Gustatory receptor n=1 Tax=Orchesella dallaii TaxID=48710 RepID=A0ABP1QKA3_9HEXA